MHVFLGLRGVCNTMRRYHYWIWALYLSQRASQVALMVKDLPASAGDVRDLGSIPGPGRYLGGGHGNPLQYSCLENPMNRGAWWASIHRVAKSLTQLKRLSTAGHGGFFSCSMWDLIPWPGMEPGPLCWELRILATGPPDKSRLLVFKATISWGVGDKNRSN